MHGCRYAEYCMDFVYKFGVNVVIVMLGNKIFCLVNKHECYRFGVSIVGKKGKQGGIHSEFSNRTIMILEIVINRIL